MSEPLQQLMKTIDYSFKTISLLETACTHRSFGAAHNERLEFLGDAVLGMVIAAFLYEAHPQVNEGVLTQMRSQLVRRSTLTAVADELGIEPYMRFGRGEAQKSSLLADAVEALLGAVYLDGGYSAAQHCVRRWFGGRLEVVSHMPEEDKDAKTALQEWLQGRGMPLPVYDVTAKGPVHQRVFQAQCCVQGIEPVVGEPASTRREAEKRAAKKVLERLQHDR